VLKFSSIGFELFLINVFFVVVVVATLKVYCNNSLGCTIYGAPSQTTFLGGQSSWLYQEAIGSRHLFDAFPFIFCLSTPIRTFWSLLLSCLAY
jgi:hypothetical protein